MLMMDVLLLNVGGGGGGGSTPVDPIHCFGLMHMVM